MVWEIDPGHRHGPPFQGDGGVDRLHAIDRGWVDQADPLGRGLATPHQAQHALGQTEGVKVLALEKTRLRDDTPRVTC